MRTTNSIIRIGIFMMGLFMVSACQSGTEVSSRVASEEPASEPALAPSIEATEFAPTATVDSRPHFEGTVAFYSDMAGNPDIYIIQADGSGLIQLTDDPAFDDSPDLSPDGMRVVFLSARNDPAPQFPDFKYDIYVVNIDGTGLTQLTDTEGGEDHPAWSPDGKRILFDADYDGDGFYEIYSMAAEGNDLVRLTTGPQNDQFGEYSPDGEQIAFSSDRNGNWDIYKMDADGGNQTALTDHDNWDVFPTWSPDGQWIAFVHMVPGSGESNVYTVHVNGHNFTKETWGSNYNENPTFSPDGQWIAFQSNIAGHFDIYVTAYNSEHHPYRMFNFPSDELWPSWGISPNPTSTASD